MPVQYEVTIEHETVRNHVGVFDVSHMGGPLIEGEEALQLIQKLVLMMHLNLLLAKPNTVVCLIIQVVL